MYKCEKCNREFKNNGGYIKHINSCNLDKNIIKLILCDYTENLLSYREINEKYKISFGIIKKILSDLSRNSSDGYKNFVNKNPNYYKTSDETKNKLSRARKKWLFENQDKNSGKPNQN